MDEAKKKKNLEAYQNPDLTTSLWDRVMALNAAIADDPDYLGPDTIAHRAGNTKLLKVEPGRTEWEMDVTPAHANKSGNMHGGMACIILDNLTSTALLTLAKPGFLDAGHVSRTITMSYLRPVPIGAKIKVVAEAVAAGRNTANLRGEIQIDGKTCVTCIHDKVVFKKGEVHPNQKPKQKAKL
jgi:acyl-coenzyme A thioesterase 13